MRYFDLHTDTARVCFKKNIMPDDTSLAASIRKGGIFDEWYQCSAVFVPDNSDDPKKEYIDILNDYRRKISGYNKPQCLLTLENGSPIDSLDFIERLYEDGISAVTLTWNNENVLAGGVNCEAGLKPFGKEVIKALNEYKIAIDLSHLNRRSFFEAGEVADTVFVSHTCCYKTHRHPRNLTDEQIKYVAERGGVTGICFYPEFLGTKYSFEGVWRHVNHLLNLGLQKSVCFGSDFDGADMADNLDGIEKIPDLYAFLNSRGLTYETLDCLFFKNARDFFENF